MNIYPSAFGHLYKTYPLTVVDVGASDGLTQVWSSHRRYLRIIGFEPDFRAFKELQNQGSRLTRYFNVGLNDKHGPISFYLTRKQKNSSCFLPNRNFLNRFHNASRYDIVEEVTIPCKSLDEVLHEGNLNDIDFIKLDTQGSELAILQGATSVLAHSVFGLEIEVAFAQIYEGEPLFSDIDRFLRPFGFDLIDLRTTSWKRKIGITVGRAKGQLIAADALYLRQPLALLETLKKHDNRMARSKLLRALSVCQTYAFLDYALELLDLLGSNYFEEHELKNLQKHIRAQAPLSSRIPNFPGRKRLANFFNTIAKHLTVNRDKFKQPHLGNF